MLRQERLPRVGHFLLAVRCIPGRSNVSKVAYFLIVIYKASNSHYVLTLYIIDATSLGHPRESQLPQTVTPAVQILPTAHQDRIARSLKFPESATVKSSSIPVCNQNTDLVSAHIPHAEKARRFR